MMTSLQTLLGLFLTCLVLSDIQAIPQVVNPSTLDCTYMQKSTRELLSNPPDAFELECVPQKVLREFLDSPSHVHWVLDCLKDELCSQKKGFLPGYDFIAGELLNHVGSGGTCKLNCNDKLNDVIKQTMTTLRKKYPKVLTEILVLLN